jgi:hypothetical protein
MSEQAKPKPRARRAYTPAKPSVVDALTATLISPNELGRNFEAANVVDGLFAIARGLHAVAEAIRESDRRAAAATSRDRDRGQRRIYAENLGATDDQVERFIDAIERATGRTAKRTDSGWIASCPCPGHRHDDRNPSLSISIGHTQPVVVKCQACAEHDFGAVCAAAGLDQCDFMRKAA